MNKIFLCFLVLIVVTYGCERQDYREIIKDNPHAIDTAKQVQDTAILSVSEAQYKYSLGQANPVRVGGYIVGVIDGMQMRNLQVNGPFLENTNIVLADKAQETNPTRVLPVKLTKDTSFRTVLNLVDNPLNQYRYVIITSTLDTYFGVCGMKNVVNYQFEEKSPLPEKEEIDKLVLSSDSEIVIGGRVILF